MSEQLKAQFTQRIIKLQHRVDSIHQDFAKGRDADWQSKRVKEKMTKYLTLLRPKQK